MIKTLQKKFIRSAMLAVTLLLALFLAAVNIADYTVSRREESRMLSLVMEDQRFLGPGHVRPWDRGEGVPSEVTERAESGKDALPNLPEGTEGGNAALPELPEEVAKGREEALFGERYFIVRMSSEGAVISSDLTHLPTDEAERAEALAAEAFESGEKSGRLGGYRFIRRDDPAEEACVFGFVDETRRLASVFRVLVLTLLVGAACWGLMLLLVIFLSKRAIVPIAENIERQKRFVTDAGHEIKTPLAIIRANADVLELHGGKSKWLDHIRSQTDRLDELTQNMLLLARMEEGESGVAAEWFDAGAAAAGTAETFREAAQMRGLSLKLETGGGQQFFFRKDAFLRLVALLVENAVKYAEAGGEIKVSVSAGKRGVELSVSNPCEKLPEGDPDRLFDRFYRADEARSRKTGGSGIGLSVARAIAESTGGSIEAVFGPGRAITFTARLCPAGGRKKRS